MQRQSYKLFFNATGHKGEISEELRALLNYFLDPEQMPEGEKTESVKKIDDIVDFANRDNDWRRGYMTYAQAQMDAMNRGIAIGEEKGKDNQARLTALNMHKAGIAVNMIAQMIGYAIDTVTGWISQSE